MQSHNRLYTASNFFIARKPNFMISTYASKSSCCFFLPFYYIVPFCMSFEEQRSILENKAPLNFLKGLLLGLFYENPVACCFNFYTLKRSIFFEVLGSKFTAIWLVFTLCFFVSFFKKCLHPSIL